MEQQQINSNSKTKKILLIA